MFLQALGSPLQFSYWDQEEERNLGEWPRNLSHKQNSAFLSISKGETRASRETEQNLKNTQTKFD